MSSTSINGQSSCTRSGGIFTHITMSGSATSWSNVSNVSASDNVYASIPAGSLSSSGDYTDYFQVANFEFSIASGATISGILVEIERADINMQKITE